MALQHKDDYINLRVILDRLLTQWKLFVISFIACMALAIVYLKIVPRLFEVKAALQLNDQSLSDKGTGKEKFISGLELFDGKSEIEDEIGILSSQTLIERTLQKVNFGVTYFSYPSTLGWIGRNFQQEIYNAGITIKPVPNKPQLINASVYLSFVDSMHYRIIVEEINATIFNAETQEVYPKEVDISVDQTLSIHKPFLHQALSFDVQLDSNFHIDPNTGYYFQIRTLESLTKEYANKIRIAPISEESSIVNISSIGAVPEKEIDFINTLANLYIENDFQKKNQLGIKTIEFIDRQLNSVHDSLATAESNLKSFRASNHIIDISTTAENLNRQLQELEKERAQLTVQQDYLKHALSYLNQNGNTTEVITPSTVGINDPFLNTMLSQLAELTREKIEKSYNSKEHSPLLGVIEEKISKTKIALLEIINNHNSSVALTLNENKRRFNELQVSMNKLPESERNLINIERKFTFSDNIYNYLLQKRAEAGIALASNLPDKSIVDTARLVSKKPISPDSKLILIAAFVAGIAIPVVIIVIGSFLNNKVQDKNDLEKITDLKVVGMITAFKKQTNALPVLYGNAAEKEAFKFLIINLKQLFNINNNQIIGISSPQQADGKTFCAMNTAAMFATSGKKTIFIDADLQKNNKKEILKNGNRSLSDFLKNDIPWTSLISRSEIGNLSIIQAGNHERELENSLLVNEKKLDLLFNNLKNNFDIIIVDTPPLTMMSDYFSLTKYFEINLIIVRYNATDRRLLEEAVPLIKLRSLKNVGIVFNDVRSSKLKEYGFTYYLQK